MSSGQAGAGSPSLDLGKNNSTSPESVENGQSEGSERYDCREVYRNFRFEAAVARDGEDEPPTAPYRCGSWDCYCCGYRMRQNLVEEIERVATARPELSRLLTLTLDPEMAPRNQETQHYYITERWNALRTALNREFGDTSFIWVREEQESGLPHLHILVSRFIPQKWLSEKWADLGGGEVVDIRQIERVEKAAHYVGKYLTKDALSGFPDGIRRYGSSQDIELSVRSPSGDSERNWDLLMEDYEITRPETGEPLTRGVVNADFARQKAQGGPIGVNGGLDPPD